MNILIIGAKKNYNAEYFYAKAFRLLGHTVSIVDQYDGVKNPLYARLLHTRTSLFSFTLKYFNINMNITNFATHFNPDFILVFKGELLSNATLEKLDENYKMSLFYPDTYRFEPLLKNRLQYFNSIFTASNKTDFYYKLGAKKVYTIPWACDPDFHKKINTGKKYNLSFIGTMYLDRKKIIDKLNNVVVFGNFWNKNRKNRFPAVYGDNFVKTINETAVNLNLHNKADVIADAPNMRTFEISGCSGFQITNYMPSLKKYFPDIVTFKNVNELKELIDYYLDNTPERDEIAIKCNEICIKKFKYIDSAKMILSAI